MVESTAPVENFGRVLINLDANKNLVQELIQGAGSLFDHWEGSVRGMVKVI